MSKMPMKKSHSGEDEDSGPSHYPGEDSDTSSTSKPTAKRPRWGSPIKISSDEPLLPPRAEGPPPSSPPLLHPTAPVSSVPSTQGQVYEAYLRVTMDLQAAYHKLVATSTSEGLVREFRDAISQLATVNTQFRDFAQQRDNWDRQVDTYLRGLRSLGPVPILPALPPASEPQLPPLPPLQQRGSRHVIPTTSTDEVDDSLHLTQLSDEQIANEEEVDGPEEEEEEESERGSVPVPPSSQVTTTTTNTVKTVDEIYDKVFGALKRLHESRPDHPIFGQPANKKIQCPLGPLGGSSEVSWHTKIKDLAKRIARGTGAEMAAGSCWLVTNDQLLWQKKINGKTLRYANCSVPRLLCFLQDPSDQAWTWLTGQLYGVAGQLSLNSPFCHRCHNGESSYDTKSATKCVNGFEHGFFGTITVNNNMKGCATQVSGKWGCPGHLGLDNKVYKCVFVNRASGALQPCRNSETRREQVNCKHAPNCWAN